MTEHSPDGHGVVVGLADIYRQLLELTVEVRQLVSRTDTVDRLVARHESELRPLNGAADRLADHEERIRTLESNRWPLPTVGLLIALASLAVAIFVAVNK